MHPGSHAVGGVIPSNPRGVSPGHCILRGAFVLALVFSTRADPAEIRVTDEAAKPVLETMVVCVRGGSDAALTGKDGVATLPDTCREVYCERGELVPDRAVIENGKATCVLRAGLDLTVELATAHCGKGTEFEIPGESPCYAMIRDARATDPRSSLKADGPRRFDSGSLQPSPADRRMLLRRFHPLAPGPYRLFVSRFTDRWECGVDLGTLPAGERHVTVVWRDPVVVRGRVLDRAGKPVADVPLFVRAVEPAGQGAPGSWVCATEAGEAEPTTAADGSFHLSVDPGVPVRIEAGWKGYPIGTAAASVNGPVERDLVLRLE